ILFIFFFFQAEDGIRDKLVTGVQTCALPISMQFPAGGRVEADDRTGDRDGQRFAIAEEFTAAGVGQYPCLPEIETGRQEERSLRSEERRVGKECRSRWSTYPVKKKREMVDER